MPPSKNLIFEIYTIEIKNNHTSTAINGNWMFNIELENMIVNKNTEEYICSYNKYIKNISTKLDETSFKIDIELTNEINKYILHEFDNIKLQNSTNKTFELLVMDYRKNYSNTDIHIEFDVSKYSENINTLYLYVKFDTDKEFNIILKK